MVSDELVIQLAAALALVGLMLYAVLGGADFGGGIWDLFATGPRKRAQRDAIAHAMGPVWEANHVWLIFVVVVLFTCFPQGYVSLAIALFIPLHLVLVGIMLRGAAFVFRNLRSATSQDAGRDRPAGRNWGLVFGIASVITPFLLGLVFGVVTHGGIRVADDGAVSLSSTLTWLRPYPVGCGLLALSTSAYLAAVYLTVETDGPLRDDFHRRAVLAGTTTAGLAALVLVLAWFEASWFLTQLFSGFTLAVVLAGMVLFALSAWATFARYYKLSRIFAVGQVVVLLLGWGLAQQPYMIYPDVTFAEVAAPVPTVRFLLWTLPFGGLILVPSLWFLFRVFKAPSRQPEKA